MFNLSLCKFLYYLIIQIIFDIVKHVPQFKVFPIVILFSHQEFGFLSILLSSLCLCIP